jgi:hypothetical protein
LFQDIGDTWRNDAILQTRQTHKWQSLGDLISSVPNSFGDESSVPISSLPSENSAVALSHTIEQQVPFNNNANVDYYMTSDSGDPYGQASPAHNNNDRTVLAYHASSEESLSELMERGTSFQVDPLLSILPSRPPDHLVHSIVPDGSSSELSSQGAL